MSSVIKEGDLVQYAYRGIDKVGVVTRIWYENEDDEALLEVRMIDGGRYVRHTSNWRKVE